MRRDTLAQNQWPLTAVLGGVWLRAKETEISAALWAMWLVKDFTFSSSFPICPETAINCRVCLINCSVSTNTTCRSYREEVDFKNHEVKRH